jgi:hypothetical protein
MARFKDEASRRAWFHERYGEEEGETRYQKALQKTPADPPLDAEQDGGDLLNGVLRKGKAAERMPRRARKRPDKRELMMAVGAGVAAVNSLAAGVYPPWSDDRLSHEEIGRLSDALVDEILNSERLTHWVLHAKEQGVHIKLAYALATIALPRMAKHGMIPPEMVGMVGGQMPASEIPPEMAAAMAANGMEPPADGYVVMMPVTQEAPGA